MLNLYWKSKAQTINVVEKPFASEADFERYIFENQEILGGDIQIIHRQIRSGSKQGIPDMLGVDQDARVCIIELKNAEAGEDVLPQALGYAIWAETNPDSIKAIWLESTRKPADIQIDWDNMDLRVILIAPSFKSTVPRMAGKIGYSIDLIEVRRYGLEDNEFVIVETLQESPQRKPSTTKVMGTWDWDYYVSEHGSDATTQFRKAVERLAEFVTRRGWNLPYNINKYYTGFKLGNRVVFSVAWGGTYAWKIRMKLPETTAKGFSGRQWEFQSYDQTFGEAQFRPLKPDAVNISELEGLMEEAYQRASGSTH